LVKEKERARGALDGAVELAARLADERDALRRRVEELERIVGGKYIFFKERYGVGDKMTKALSQLIDEMEKKTT
jgi:hypothetical protein